MERPPKPTPEQRARLVQLGALSRSTVERLADRLPAHDLRRLREFAFAGEWPLLADLLAAVLLQEKTPVSAVDREAVRELLYWWAEPVKGYRYIEARDDVLASLNVVEV